MAIRIKELEETEEKFSVESLSQNEVFITTVMYATQVAIRSHQEEKLEALRNAVLNTALSNAPEEDIQMMFLNFIDALTPWHLRLLKFLDDPKDFFKKKNISIPKLVAGGVSNLVEGAFPELKSNREFYDLLAKELFAKGLINSSDLHVIVSESALYGSGSTKFGKSFLAYIS